MSAKTWFLALRPKTLSAAAAPVAVGWAIAVHENSADSIYALIALVGALLIQVGTNFANDYFDFIKGADTDERVGPKRATQSGDVSPKTMRNATVAVFALAALVGVALMLRGGWPIVVIGVLSIASGVLYTGGPKPLAYVGLGDLFVWVFFGPVAVCGTVYVQSLNFSVNAFWAGIALGALATAVLCVNNIRDAHTDVHAGKRTLAVRFGKSVVRAEYLICYLVGYLGALYFAFNVDIYCALPILTLPFAIHLCVQVFKKERESLNPYLGKSGALLMAYSLLMALGFWL